MGEATYSSACGKGLRGPSLSKKCLSAPHLRPPRVWHSQLPKSFRLAVLASRPASPLGRSLVSQGGSERPLPVFKGPNGQGDTCRCHTLQGKSPHGSATRLLHNRLRDASEEDWPSAMETALRSRENGSPGKQPSHTAPGKRTWPTPATVWSWMLVPQTPSLRGIS